MMIINNNQQTTTTIILTSQLILTIDQIMLGMDKIQETIFQTNLIMEIKVTMVLVILEMVKMLVIMVQTKAIINQINQIKQIMAIITMETIMIFLITFQWMNGITIMAIMTKTKTQEKEYLDLVEDMVESKFQKEATRTIYQSPLEMTKTLETQSTE